MRIVLCMRWHPIVKAFKRQEDHKFWATLGYIARFFDVFNKMKVQSKIKKPCPHSPPAFLLAILSFSAQKAVYVTIP